MPVIYLRHETHGEKVAFSEVEAKADRENGWVDFDPTAPKVEQESEDDEEQESEVDEEQESPAPPAEVPAFLAPVASDLPEDFPGRDYLIAAGHTTWAGVADLDREGLIALKGIGEKTADAILKVMNG